MAEIFAHLIAFLFVISPIISLLFISLYLNERKHSKSIMNEFEQYKDLVNETMTPKNL